MGINPTIQLSKAISDADSLQTAIADIQNRMDAAILAESGEDIAGLRLELAKLKAGLGQSRNEEAFWRGEVNAEKDARKSQADIARA
jgi:hypothetical protein